MFRFKQINGPYGDCTADYDVFLDIPYTVQSFIDDVLTYSLKNREWGYIGIYKKGEIFGDPNCEYSYGKVITKELPDYILQKDIVKVEANGGWSRMDYLIYI